MKTYDRFRTVGLWTVVAGAALCARAEVTVYDGMPVSGTGAYASGSTIKLWHQNSSHVSIIGENGQWDGSDTGTMVVSPDGLAFPSGFFLPTQPGSLIMTSTAASTTGQKPRSLYRACTPLSGRSFYFGVLMAYDDLSNYAVGDYAVWGLTRTLVSTTSYPPANDICVGFRKTASGVEAVLRVMGQLTVIRSDVAPGTWFFTGRFDYNAAGNDTVSVSLAAADQNEEPTVWEASVSTEVLTSSQSFGFVCAAFAYPINGKWVKADEWRVGDTWTDIAGESVEKPVVENASATVLGVSSAELCGTLFSTGTSATAVSVYYGDTDGGAEPSAWQHAQPVSVAVTNLPQTIAFVANDLTPYAVNYFRYAASNESGLAFAPLSTAFQWVSPGLLVYDGVPVNSSGAYAGSDSRLYPQGSSHASIVGETGAWAGTDTGVIVVSDDGLSYPPGIPLHALGGTLKLTSVETSHDSTYLRALSRPLTTPLAGKPFYFSVLMSCSNLAYYASGQYAAIGLTRTGVTAGGQYPPANGILVGFQRTADGVSAVLRVLNQSYVLRDMIADNAVCLFACKFDYSPFGADVVSASVIENTAEPAVWAAVVTNEVLTSDQALGYVSVGCHYGLAGAFVKADEWRVADAWEDVAGRLPGLPYIVNGDATNVTASAAWLTGALITDGGHPSAVSVYYGTTDGGDDPGGWEHVHAFPGVAASETQSYTFLAEGLASGTRHYYRYAVSNELGTTFAPWPGSFLPQGYGPPQFAPGAAATAVGLTTATLLGQLELANPETTVYVCLDTADRGAGSATGDWSRVELAGVYTLPSSLAHTVSDLHANADIVFRFFATNETGYAWSDAAVFTTGLPALTIADACVDEGNAGLVPVSLQVQLDAVSARETVVHYATEDFTATAGVHYVASSGDLTIPPGVTQTNLTFLIIANTREEFPGTAFWVRLTSLSGATVGTTPAEVNILDDDLGQRVFFDGFGDGNANGWTATPSGTWSVSGQTYKKAFGNSGRSVMGEMDWSNYGVRAMMRVTVGWNWLYLYAYNREAVSEGTGYRFGFERTDGWGAYAPQLYAGTNKIADAGSTGISNTRVGTTILRPVAMRVRRTPGGGNRVQCWVGSRLVFDQIDTTLGQTSGGIGVGASQWTDAYFDNVEVWAYPQGTLVTVK